MTNVFIADGHIVLNMENNKVTIPIFGLCNVIIFLAFFFAKIFDKIDWSWWWVFSPLWLVPVCVICFYIILLIIYLLLTFISNIWK